MSEKINPMTTTVLATSGIRALTEIAWMAKRRADDLGPDTVRTVHEARWLLDRLAGAMRLTGSGETLVPPSQTRQVELTALPVPEAVQWLVDVLHPLAHQYVDGRSTYAPGMFNDATRVLRAAGFSLAATEALGKSVWVTDGMGDSFLSLSDAERRERDRARRAS